MSNRCFGTDTLIRNICYIYPTPLPTLKIYDQLVGEQPARKMSMRYSSYCSLVLCYCLVTVILFSESFSNFPLHDISSRYLSQGSFQHLIKAEKLRNQLCLFAAPKRKDNRRYVAKPKDDEDEVDDDYFQELAEDVKELLRSAKYSATTSGFIPIGSVSDSALLPNIDIVEVNRDEIDVDDYESTVSSVGIFEQDADENYVTSPDDIIDDSDEGNSTTAGPTNEWREQVQVIIQDIILKQGLYVQKIFWGGNRVEVVLSGSEDPLNPIGPSVSALQLCHRSMYEEFESREGELAVVSKFEIVVASPGIGEILRTDQDFISFKGFTVAVTTSEIYRKKTTFEGTLVERSGDNVCISLKGRPVKIPRDIITEVRLPKPKYEATDTEMRKLR